MQAAKVLYVAGLLLGLIILAPFNDAEAVAAPQTSPQGIIFVLNSYNVDAYPIDGHGNVSPIAVTTGMAAPRGIARDGSGRIYVTNSAINTISVYAPLGTETGILDEAPINVIAGSQTLLSGPTGIAIDGFGDIYTVNGSGGPNLPGEDCATGVVTVYAAGSEGNVAPVETISGVATGLINPSSIALDRAGDIYIANEGAQFAGGQTYDPSITVYPPGSSGNAQPIATITGNNTGLGYPLGLAVDSSG